MKRILIVNNNMHIGGVQKALLNLLQTLHADYDITLLLFYRGGALLNEYGRAVAVTTGAYVYGNNMYLCVPLDPVLEADLTGEGMTLQEVLDAVTAAREAAAAAAEAGESR